VRIFTYYLFLLHYSIETCVRIFKVISNSEDGRSEKS